MTTKAIEARERAAAKFKEAHDLAGGKDYNDLDAEQKQAFDALFAEAKAADDEFKALAPGEGINAELKERLGFYFAKSTGNQLDWSKLATVGGNPEAQGFHYNGGLLLPKSLGETFAESAEYKELLEGGALNSDRAAFKTSPVGLKATSDVVRVGGTGSSLITPQYLPGILPLPQRPLTIRDLFSQATTQTDTISYAYQNAFDNGAATVAEADSADSTDNTGRKPQSSIGWARTSTTVETIATWMATTRRMLADAGQVRSIIDNQLQLMIKLEEEDQLLSGDGNSPNISGLLDRSGLQTLDLSSSTSDRANLDGIRTAKRLVKTGPARLDADAVVVNPEDSEEFDLMVDAMGRYRAGDPFGTGPETPPIWRLRRVESEAVTAGTALVGAFRAGATVFEREGIVVLTSDSHSDFFVKNLIAVLAEERLALAVFFPAAFCIVTLADWE